MDVGLGCPTNTHPCPVTRGMWHFHSYPHLTKGRNQGTEAEVPKQGCPDGKHKSWLQNVHPNHHITLLLKVYSPLPMHPGQPDRFPHSHKPQGLSAVPSLGPHSFSYLTGPTSSPPIHFHSSSSPHTSKLKPRIPSENLSSQTSGSLHKAATL